MDLAKISDPRAALDLGRCQHRDTGANTVAIATLTQTSMGPSSRFHPLGRCFDGLGVGDVGRNGKRAHAVALGRVRRGKLQPSTSRLSSARTSRGGPNSSATARPTPAPAPVITTIRGMISSSGLAQTEPVLIDGDVVNA